MRRLAWMMAAAIGALHGAPAEAHVLGAWGGGFAAGLGHPFGGLDHLLAMIKQRVAEAFPEAEILDRSKNNAAIGAPVDVLDQIAQEADWAITAMAD